MIVLSCLGIWVLLTVFAVALAQQPKVRRTLQKEIADYTANAEARAFAAEQADEQAAATKAAMTATSSRPDSIGPMIMWPSRSSAVAVDTRSTCRPH